MSYRGSRPGFRRLYVVLIDRKEKRKSIAERRRKREEASVSFCL